MSHTNIMNDIVPILGLLVVLAVCYTTSKIMTWNVEPWRRKYLKPRKQWIEDWWRVRIYKLRSKHVDVFAAPNPIREQTINPDHVIDDVVKVVEAVKHDQA